MSRWDAARIRRRGGAGRRTAAARAKQEIPMRAADLSSQFPAHVRDRGYEYQRREAVQLTTVSGTSIEARVNGTRQYQVRIGVRGSNLDFTCTCSFFQDRGPCKHLWATLVQADQEGLLRTLAQAQGL